MVDSKSARARGRRRPSWAVTAAEARSGDYGRGRGCRSSDGMRRHPGVPGFGINHLIPRVAPVAALTLALVLAPSAGAQSQRAPGSTGPAYTGQPPATAATT